MTGGSGDLKLKLLLALRELVASDPISVRLRRVARGIHTLVEPDFPSELPQVWQRFHALKDVWPGNTLFRGRTKRQSPRTKLKGWRKNFSIYLPSSAIRERFGLLVGKIGV